MDPFIYRECRATITARIPDTVDADLHPDRVLVQGRGTAHPQFQGGSVVFTEIGEYAIPQPIPVVIVDGELLVEVLSGDESVETQPLYLPVTVDERANQNWSWRLVFDFLTLGEYGEEVSHPPLSFPVEAGDGPLEISTVASPVIKSQGFVTRGQPGAGITSITTRNGRVVIEWEGGDDVSIPVPGAEYVDTRVSTVRNYTDATKVDTTDARLPRHAADDDILAQVQDLDGRSTWLAARTSDGGPTDWSERLIRERIGVHAQPAHGYLFALLDAQGKMTDLTLRSTDGRFTDEVVDGLATRIRDRMPHPTMYADAPYTPGASVLPANATADALAGWGSSTIEGLRGQLELMAQAHGMSWHAGGRGGEWVEHTAARMNAIPARLTFPDDTIPASGSVVVTSENLPPKASLRPYAGFIAGIAGTLSSTDTQLTFTRTSVGDPAPVAPGAEFVSDLGIEHRNDTLILNVGKNNLTHSNPDRHDPAAVAAKTMRMVEYHAALHKRVLVLGQFVNTGTPAVSAARDRIYEADAILSRELGALFFDTHAWVTSSQYWVDVGAEPTADDLSEQALGNKPHTGSLDNGHFNTAGYQAYRKQIEAAMSSLGWLS